MTLPVSVANEKVAVLMPDLIDDLKRFASIPSCAFPGFPAEPVLKMAHETVESLKQAGATNADLIDMPGGYPAVFAEIRAKDPNAPTILLYAHYDVQPAPADQAWDTDPWIPTEKDGRIYGRGIADDKSGIAVHLGTLKMFDGEPPINIKVLIEGEEETGNDNLAQYILEHPEIAQCDAFIIADSGNQTPGQPALTTGLRGLVSCRVTIRTLDRALHSGLFGGAAPDALVTLTQLLATLHDKDGNTAVKGLTSFEWEGADVSESDLRADAGIVENTRLVGTGSIASRMWSHPSVTIIGMDVPPIAGTPNALVPEASAKLSLRIAPGADTKRELDALIEHLETNVLWGAQLTIEPLESGAPFLLANDDPMADIAIQAMSEAWGTPTVRMGAGGSIPLVAVLQETCPQAGVLILGAEDTQNARIHSSNESVDPREIERCIVAQSLFIDRLATI